MLINLMPDECTNSTITWFNSTLHGNQKAQILVNMIQSGQWYGNHEVGGFSSGSCYMEGTPNCCGIFFRTEIQTQS